MIVPMKKYSFLVYHKEYVEFLEEMQKLGVLHVIEKESGEIENEELREQYQRLKDINDTIQFLSKRNTIDISKEIQADAVDIIEKVKSLQEESEHVSHKIASLNKEISLLEPWGNFSWDVIQKLTDSGIHIRFYTCTSRKYNSFAADYSIEKITELSGFTYFVLFEKDGEVVEIDAEELKLPKRSLEEITEDKENNIARLEKIALTFDELADKYLYSLQEIKQQLTAQLDFNNVVLNTVKAAEDKLMLLEGWVPEENENELKKFLDKSGVYFQIEKPTEEDAVPIKLKNNRFAKLYEAIGELYSLPDYKEIDLTPFFAPFFMLFFGFCLGDAGYGVLMLLGATLFKLKVKKEMKPLLSLVQFLGLATVLFGALTGTIFGINLIDSGYTITDQSVALLLNENIPAAIIDKLEVLKGSTFETKVQFGAEVKKIIGDQDFVTYGAAITKYTESDYSFLNSFRHLLFDPQKMFNLALIIGGIQIIFGMFLKMANQIKQFGVKYAFSTIGWLFLIIGLLTLIVLSKMNVIAADKVKPLLYILLGISSLGILLFNDPKRNILMNIGAGVWDTYNMITGVLGDMLSYIRLFALGISSAILGFVFNDLAMNMSPDTIVLKQLVMIIILLFGHGINIFMAGLGSFVHPMRLTFVEFYKNAGFTGGGGKYRPFSK